MGTFPLHRCITMGVRRASSPESSSKVVQASLLEEERGTGRIARSDFNALSPSFNLCPAKPHPESGFVMSHGTISRCVSFQNRIAALKPPVPAPRRTGGKAPFSGSRSPKRCRPLLIRPFMCGSEEEILQIGFHYIHRSVSVLIERQLFRELVFSV